MQAFDWQAETNMAGKKMEADCGVIIQRGPVATLFFRCQNGVLNLMYIPAMRI